MGKIIGKNVLNKLVAIQKQSSDYKKYFRFINNLEFVTDMLPSRIIFYEADGFLTAGLCGLALPMADECIWGALQHQTLSPLNQSGYSHLVMGTGLEVGCLHRGIQQAICCNGWHCWGLLPALLPFLPLVAKL